MSSTTDGKGNIKVQSDGPWMLALAVTFGLFLIFVGWVAYWQLGDIGAKFALFVLLFIVLVVLIYFMFIGAFNTLTKHSIAMERNDDTGESMRYRALQGMPSEQQTRLMIETMKGKRAEDNNAARMADSMFRQAMSVAKKQAPDPEYADAAYKFIAPKAPAQQAPAETDETDWGTW